MLKKRLKGSYTGIYQDERAKPTPPRDSLGLWVPDTGFMVQFLKR